ncbi:MAG: DUF6377 domain-containing protein [Bacteroidales bacterium]|nr:DUF6377 domain-containing protein [Bacteroidales bacterium]
MSNILFKFVVIALIVVVSNDTFAKDINTLLDRLDEVVANRNQYIQQKENEIKEMKVLLQRSPLNARYEVCDVLCNLYMVSNTDSARHYSELCLAFAKKAEWCSDVRLQGAHIKLAHCMAINGLYEQAKEKLKEVEGNLYNENKLSYYRVLTQVYIWEAEFSTLPDAYQRTEDKVFQCRDSVLFYETEKVHQIHTAAIIKAYTDNAESNRMLLPILDTMSYDNPNLRFIANTVASNFDTLGDNDSSCYYYALSAISDVSQGVMEHTSLRRLAVKLFAKGEITRAYNYINVCMEDAKVCGARLRTIQMADDLPVILNTYQETVSKQKFSLEIIIAVLAILLFVVAYSLYKIYKIQNRLKVAQAKLLRSNDDLRQSKRLLEQALQEVQLVNRDLKESNQIKEVYITNYMKQFSEGIAKLESYQQMLLKVAHTSNFGKLVQTIKNTEILDHELDVFYQSFDETFLGLFPTFVKDFNTLLRPEEQLSEPKERHLSTELRIFALIRLGINDSEDIASFLRCSVKTIYNYRTKIRNKALGDRALLEEQLMDIGITEA